jgi:hypothetical protein
MNNDFNYPSNSSDTDKEHVVVNSRYTPTSDELASWIQYRDDFSFKQNWQDIAIPKSEKTIFIFSLQ